MSHGYALFTAYLLEGQPREGEGQNSARANSSRQVNNKQPWKTAPAHITHPPRTQAYIHTYIQTNREGQGSHTVECGFCHLAMDVVLVELGKRVVLLGQLLLQQRVVVLAEGRIPLLQGPVHYCLHL